MLDDEDVIKRSKEDLERRYVKEMTALEKETHEEFKRRDDILKRSRQKRMKDADEHRKAQIRNLNEMYEWELAEAEARYKQQLTETKERLVVELSSEVVRQARIIEEHFGARSSMRTVGSTASTASASADDKPTLSSAYSIVENAPVRYMSSGRPAKRTRTGNAANALSHALPVADIRKDFVSIVKDLEERATRNEQAHQPDVNYAVPVSVDTKKQFVRVGPVPGTKGQTDGALAKEVIYPLGALVLIKSVMSEEEFSGVITAMSAHEIVVKLGHSDTRLRIYTNQIRDRRVWICPDQDLQTDAALIRDARLSLRQLAAKRIGEEAIDGSAVDSNGSGNGGVAGSGSVIAARPVPSVSS